MNRASQHPKKPSGRESIDNRVNWIVWSLQFAAGFLAGLGVGYEAWRMLFFSGLDAMLSAMLGGGLICGAFTSFYGNRAWMARSIFMAAEPEPPRDARACSVVIGSAGGILILLSLLHQMIVMVRRDHSSLSAGNFFIALLLALIPIGIVVHALRTGSGFWRFGIIEREETPLVFWVYVALNVAAAIGVLCTAL